MTIKRDISNVAATNGNATNGHVNDEDCDHEILDMLIVGAGFAGVWLIRLLRERGFRTKIVEVISMFLIHWCQTLTVGSPLIPGRI